MSEYAKRDNLYGLIATFESASHLLEATETAYQAGYRRMDAYSPFPIEGLNDALGFQHTRMPLVVLGGGLIGGLVGFGMQVYANVIAYPLNIGGRPDFSWPAFIPVTFELTILVAGFSAVLGMLWLNGLPEPYHPLFDVPDFKRASQDRFFLCIEADDDRFDYDDTRRFLEDLQPLEVNDVQV